jgi:hypothetical protein
MDVTGIVAGLPAGIFLYKNVKNKREKKLEKMKFQKEIRETKTYQKYVARR